MNPIIFKKVPLIKRSVLQTLFNQHPEENAVIELNNLLAKKPICDVNKQDVIEIGSRYNISIQHEFALNLEEFYAVYLNYCLQDGILNNSEKDDLNHLKEIFGISANSIDEITNKLSEPAYRSAYQRAIGNGRFGESEKQALDELSTDLRMSADTVNRIASEIKKQYLTKEVSTLVEKGSMSSTEEHEFLNKMRNLGIAIESSFDNGSKLKKLKRYWELEHLPLTAINTNGDLQKSEDCYIQVTRAGWCEVKGLARTFGHTASATSVKTAKAATLGTKDIKSFPSYELKQIELGSIYLTNKRIFFTGAKNHNIRLEKIVDFNCYKDGVEISKDTGKNVFLTISGSLDEFCIILKRLIA